MNHDVLIENVALNLLKLAEIRLPNDVKEALRRAHNNERSKIGKAQLKAILDNIRLAEEKSIPICQDTGLISFYLKAGYRFKDLGKIEEALCKSVQRATAEIPLRPNAIDPFTDKNTGDNIGKQVPYIHWRIVDGDYLEITALPKGGGSENTSRLEMMKPSDGLKGLKRFVVESAVKAGGMPCPPTIIGVGVGGGANIAMELAELSLLEPLDKPNPDATIAKLERELYEAVNRTKIGPMGLGGDSTTLAVKIKYAHRHIASYPVAVAFQCWAARRATAQIGLDGEVKYLTHKV